MTTGNPPPWGSHEPHIDEAALRRIRLLVRIVFFWVLVIVLRLFYLQVLAHSEYKQLAESQQQRVIQTYAPRGAIYARSGEPLAMSTTKQSVCVNPMLVRDPAMTAHLLSQVLEIKQGPLENKIWTAKKQGRGFLWVKRLVTVEEQARVEALKLTGVEFREESARYYPKGSLAAHVLGGVDHEEQGHGGIELGLQEELEGIPGTARLLLDVKRRGYDWIEEAPSQAGKSIWLSIDERLQFVAERALERMVADCKCKTASLVALDPRNGDVLAMASYPTFDLSKPAKSGDDLSVRLNQAISAPFEPGSVFKVITLAAALERTHLGPDSPINCLGGSIVLAGRRIGEAKNGFGVIPMRTVLAKSSNVGAIQVALQTGSRNLHEYIVRFGFGRKTGIPLPAEEPGTVHPPKKWGATTIGSVAMGHEIMATTLQLAQACAIVANDGRMVRPRLVLRKQRPGEPVEEQPVALGEQVISAANAARLREMMQDVVESGTGGKARIKGYEVGGKTGSAQIWDRVSGTYTERYNASFIGFAPRDQPRIAMAVTFTQSPHFGGAVAAPVFQEVAAAALRLYDVARSYDLPLPPPAQLANREAVDIPDSGNDVAAAPPQPALLADSLLLASAPLAPNLLGKTKRDVLMEISAAGLLVETKGSGLARAQRPAPGQPVLPGERIIVEFAR